MRHRWECNHCFSPRPLVQVSLCLFARATKRCKRTRAASHDESGAASPHDGRSVAGTTCVCRCVQSREARRRCDEADNCDGGRRGGTRREADERASSHVVRIVSASETSSQPRRTHVDGKGATMEAHRCGGGARGWCIPRQTSIARGMVQPIEARTRPDAPTAPKNIGGRRNEPSAVAFDAEACAEQQHRPHDGNGHT